jgi:hypothetical protein
MLHHRGGGPQVIEYAMVELGRDGKAKLNLMRPIGAPGASGAPCFNEAWQVVAIRKGREEATLLAIWAADLLADPEFTDTVKRHLPKAQSRRADKDRLVALKQVLTDSFSFDDLKILAFDLETDWDELPGQTRSEKAWSLVAHLDSKDKLDNLISRGMQLRPRAKWKAV